MIVTDRPLPNLPMDALVATEAADAAGIHEGETIGYRCEECGAGDETLEQVIHEDGCPLVGEHGRSHYDGDAPIATDAPMPELKQDHRIDIISAGWTDPSEDVHNGEPVLFRCAECGNSDETVLEIRHDEDCSLAGRHGCGSAEMADSGQ